jgi:hypothetical protein
LCRTPISTTQSFSSCTITCCAQFLYRTLIFHTHFTLRVAPCQSLVHPYRAPLTKLSCDNIYPHCAHTNQTPLHSAHTVHTTRTIIMCVHTAHTLLCVCTQRNAKFNTCTRTPTFFRAASKFSVHTHTPTFFRAASKFSAHTRTPIFFLAAPNFSVCAHTTTFFYAAPKFSVCTRTPIFFRVTPNFNARTGTPTFFRAAPSFYTSLLFYCASCIFSAPTYAHSFLCASIPCEFHSRNSGFFLTFFPNLPLTFCNYEICSISPR